MLIGEILDPGAVMARLGAKTKAQVLVAIADIAAQNFGLESGAILEALNAREQSGSTGVGHGVAVPHARIEGLSRTQGVFVRLEQPVAFDALDGQPVDLFFALFSPADSGSAHLKALARVSRLLRQPGLREQLRQAKASDAILALLNQDATSTAA